MSSRITVQEHDEAVAPGDTVNIWTMEECDVIVTAVEKNDRNEVMNVSTKTARGCSYNWSSKSGYVYKYEVTKKAPRNPQHWPPQPEDVWIAGDEVYHMLGKKMFRASDPGTIWTSPENLLRSCNGAYGEGQERELRLVYRKGNDPNV